MLSVVIIISIISGILAAPEQGVFNITLSDDQPYLIVKTLYNQSEIAIIVHPDGQNCLEKTATFHVQWMVQSSTCYAEFSGLDNPPNLRAVGYMSGHIQLAGGGTGKWLQNYGYAEDVQGDAIKCTDKDVIMKDYSNTVWHDVIPLAPEEEKEITENAGKETTATADAAKQKRDISDPDNAAQPPAKADTDKTPETDTKNKPPAAATPKAAEAKPVTKKAPLPKLRKTKLNHLVAITPEEAAYLFIIRIKKTSVENPKNGSFAVAVHLRSPKGYLSAHEYPLLTFYMIMCIVYVFYAFAWLVLSACNYKDLLRVQFWIGGVILLGMIEKAVFYSEYLNVNTSGISVIGAAKFAEIVSALKRSLARMLCIIVSLGFGIVKPRLGPMLHRVIGVGVLYFILAVVEALVRQDSSLHEPESSTLLLTYIPLSVLDAIICWWVFISLMQTMKTLRLRRNVVKLSLYRHFSNAIIFSVIASLILIFWSFRLHKDPCVSDWSELWIEQAFWHVLFSVVLLVIIVLWRPNANNQRYAFSPLIDGGDEEDDLNEPMLGSGATETMKMRGMKSDGSIKNANDKAEDDLKWIEENIPQTVADAALPALLDSDEEVMTTKYEMNKME